MSLPPRDASAPGGHAIMEAMANKSQTEREAYIIAQVKAGNIPPHMRELEPVTVRDADGSERTVYTLPDFIGVGSDDDFVRVPLSVPAAQVSAQHLGGRLPERVEVDAIYEQAGATLPFSNRTPDDTMATVPVMVEHNDYLEGIRRERGIAQGTLIAGHKKTVMAPRRKGEVTIYGWHGDRPEEGQRPRAGRGEAIQPYQTPHGEMHADYSHGVRVIFDRPATPGVVTLPEVTIVADPDAPDEPRPAAESAGVVTVPEVTITGDPDAAEAESPANEPATSESGIDAGDVAQVVGTAAAAVVLGPAAPLAAMAYRWLRRDDD
jgi:hypothetical protein